MNQVTTIVLAVLASSGFWAFLQFLFSRKDIRTQMLIGLGHDSIKNKDNTNSIKSFCQKEDLIV